MSGYVSKLRRSRGEPNGGTEKKELKKNILIQWENGQYSQCSSGKKELSFLPTGQDGVISLKIIENGQTTLGADLNQFFIHFLNFIIVAMEYTFILCSVQCITEPTQVLAHPTGILMPHTYYLVPYIPYSPSSNRAPSLIEPHPDLI